MTKKPSSISVEEFVKTATMFYIDQKLEDRYTAMVSSVVKELQTSLPRIITLDGLKAYLREDKKALDRITSLLNISEEKFKRIITMLRVQKRHMVTSEWSLEKIQQQMIDNTEFMNEVCELLMNGSTSEKFTSLIPDYYRENFRIDHSTLGRLVSEDDIRRLVKKGLEGKYNNQVGYSFNKCVTDAISEFCQNNGLTYATKENVSFLDKTFSILIPDETKPKILIDITYGITTSSGQTNYAKTAEKIADKLRELNSDKTAKEQIVYINVMDGAGWVARQSDLVKIQRSSSYLLNLSSLNIINDVMNYIYGGINK